jgi:glycerophosphoryl diester phosphodiesterase
MKHLEYDLQVAVCRYLSYQYPDIDFLSDTIANLKLTQTQANRNKKIQKVGFKTPDILILEPRNNFSGLFIELKLETPFKKDGTIKASDKDHLKGQLETIEKLNKKGYFCCFSWGFEMTKEIIDNYLKQ